MNKVSDINDIHHIPEILDGHKSHDLSSVPNEHHTGDVHDANALDQRQLPAELARLFTQLSPQDVEQFYQSYQLWILEQQIEIQQSHIAALQQKIAENAALMEQARPSAIALSTLAQLQASGVEDVALLDQMLERGEAWLDRTMQQLAYCERLDLIGESYTEWCKHALEGAYDWIESIQETEVTETSSAPEDASAPSEVTEVTEDLLLQKLMSDDDTEATLTMRPRITAPLPTLDETSLESDDITASIVNSPIVESVELVAETPATGEITEAITEIIAQPLEVVASSEETAPETTTEVEPVATTIIEHAPADQLEIEQESTEPVTQDESEVLEMADHTISQIATDIEVEDEPDQEEQLEEIVTPETTEDDTSVADDEREPDSVLAAEIEEIAPIETAEAEVTPQNEEVEAPSVAAIDPLEDVADTVKVVTPAANAASAINDTEDALTTIEQEEEQEAEVLKTPSEIELVKDESVALSPDAEPFTQEELSPLSVGTHTEPDPPEATRVPQEQPPVPQTAKKPGFFRRLLAFLLS